MKKCSNPSHPHCTSWVAPGDGVCAGGHRQGASEPDSSYALLSTLRNQRGDGAAAAADAIEAARSTVPQPLLPAPYAAQAGARGYASAVTALPVPQLHISGFDPRAAGGRQTVKMSLRGMPAHCPPDLTLLLESDLIGHGAARHQVTRTTRGDWCPLFVEFSSRDKEHGQYQIAVELHSHKDGALRQKWVCTFVILVPRPDASLTDIHQIFLSTHKNVRVVADDASIARVSAPGGGYQLDVSARNAGIAHVDLSAPQGQVDMGFTTIAWDEDLIEIDVPGASHSHPHPSRAACLVNAAPEAGAQRQIRLFALDECVFGRFEVVDPEADVLLSHVGDDGQDASGLTRRLSGRHAVIRRNGKGFEIEDVSRYGILLDGVWPGKHKPSPLRLGMRIELSASIRGIVVLSVSAILPHGVILHRIDQGAQAECYYVLAPDRHPGYPLPSHAAAPNAAALPVLFHDQGGFWHLDQLTGKETALGPHAALDKLSRVPKHNRFASEPYPECWIIRTGADMHDGSVTAHALSAA
ncbi:MAG: FHA domain-containing protein [Pseudomonadota bacterium]